LVTLELMRRYPNLNWDGYQSNPHIPIADVCAYARDQKHYMRDIVDHPGLTYKWAMKLGLRCSAEMLRRFRNKSKDRLARLVGFTEELYVEASIAPPKMIIKHLDGPMTHLVDLHYVFVTRRLFTKDIVKMLFRYGRLRLAYDLFTEGLLSDLELRTCANILPTSLAHYHGKKLLVNSLLTYEQLDSISSRNTMCNIGFFDVLVMQDVELFDQDLDLNNMLTLLTPEDQEKLFWKYPDYPWRHLMRLDYMPEIYNPEDHEIGVWIHEIRPEARKEIGQRYPAEMAEVVMWSNTDLLFAIAYGHYSHEPRFLKGNLTCKEVRTLEITVDFCNAK